jgi:hypothetical protein
MKLTKEQAIELYPVAPKSLQVEMEKEFGKDFYILKSWEKIKTLEDALIVNGKTLKSLRKLFVESEDPTGYSTATEHLGGYSHWEALCKSSIKGEIEKWKAEMEVRIRSLGLKATVASARSGNFNAAKFLAEKGWDKRIAGRPSKEDVARETKVQAQLHSEVVNDLLRMEMMNGENLPIN